MIFWYLYWFQILDQCGGSVPSIPVAVLGLEDEDVTIFKNFFIVGTRWEIFFTPFQLLQITLGKYRFTNSTSYQWDFFLNIKICNFEPFWYVIKSVLLKKEEDKRLFY
jgi:hypothetical protein